MVDIYFQIGIANVLIISISIAVFLFFKKINNQLFASSILSLGAGLLIVEAFNELIPHNIEEGGQWWYVVIGLVFFLIIESFIHSGPKHEHKIGEEIDHNHGSIVIALIADGLHNFTDGIVVALAFVSSLTSGWTTTLGILIHELPQELSDLALLKTYNLSQIKALTINTLVSLTMPLGSLFGLFAISNLAPSVLPNLSLISAGSLIFLGVVKMLPIAFLNQKFSKKEYLLVILAFIIGGFIARFLHIE